MDFSVNYDERTLEGIIISLTPTLLEVKMTIPYNGICKKINLEENNEFRPLNWPQLESDFLDVSVFFADNNITSFGINMCENILKDIYDVCNSIFLNIHIFKEDIEKIEKFFNGEDYKSLGFTHNQAKIAEKMKKSQITPIFMREQIEEFEKDVQLWFKKFFSRADRENADKFTQLIDFSFDVL
ncbi:MAG: hypothetical protein M0Q02_12760 [Candidatus Muirbacterium halophilum]|nr:hypothetical protein [Candidatus Muirbacterium halophilum]